MKNIKWLSGAFIMALGLLVFGACSDDDEKETPSFPEKIAIDCAVGEVKTLTFHAENAWTLASSRLWCKFKDGNDVVSSLSGGPGEQTVTVTVTEDIWGFEDAVADIIMGMDGQAQTIAVVNRAAKGYHIEAYEMQEQDKINYNESNPLKLPYKKSMQINVVANFDWKIKNCPEWLQIEETLLIGEAGKTISWDIQFKVSETFPSAREQNVNLQFEDMNGAVRLTIPIMYGGIPEDVIEFVRPLKNYWNWYFSGDASLYWQSSGMPSGGDIVKYDAPLMFKAISKDGFEVVRIEITDQYGYSPVENPWGTTWFTGISLGNDELQLQIEENTGAPRRGCLMVVPKSVLAGLADDGIFGLVYPDFSGVKPEFEDYIAFEFTQEGTQVVSKGFKVLDDAGNSMASRIVAANSMIPSEELISTFGTDNVYMLTLDGNKSYETITVTPNGYPNGKCDYEIKSGAVWNDVFVEPNWKNGIYIGGISNGEKDEMQIIFKNENTVFAVLLVSQFND